MFIGHFALGLAAKRVAPRTSLGTLFAAAQLLDLVWPILLLAGLEQVRIDPGNTAVTPLDFVHYPWTHSLAMAVAWAVAFAAVYRWRTGYGRGALVAGALVLSHWALDFVTHRPDLPLAPGAAKVGLGLWNSPVATVVVEGALFVLGVFLYAAGTRSRNRRGRVSFVALVVFLGGVYLANLAGPPPPSAEVIAVAGLTTWLFVPWGAWIDRNRELLSPAAARR